MTLLKVKGKLPFEFLKLTHAFIHVFFFHFVLCISSYGFPSPLRFHLFFCSFSSFLPSS